MNLAVLAEDIYLENKAKGFWDKERNFGETLMLVVSELSEALEAHRKGRFVQKLDDVELYPSHKEWYDANIKGTVEEEIADSLIRILDLCAGFNIDIDYHVQHKRMYNRQREYLHGKKY